MINFSQKSKFWSKIQILAKHRNFVKKWCILVKNRNFGQKFKFCSKIEILFKNRNFSRKSILIEISIFLRRFPKMVRRSFFETVLKEGAAFFLVMTPREQMKMFDLLQHFLNPKSKAARGRAVHWITQFVNQISANVIVKQPATST